MKVNRNVFFAYAIGFLAVCIVSLLPRNTMSATKSDWYSCIRSDITPPNIVFPIVWTILYIMIAISIAQTILAKIPIQLKQQLYVAFIVNLTLNVFWSFAFFGSKRPDVALFIIILLWLSIVYIIVTCYKNPALKFVGVLMTPYLLWVSFASLLNYLAYTKQMTCKGK